MQSSARATRPKGSPTFFWLISELPAKLSAMLESMSTAVKPTPRHRLQPGHLTLTYHCHRGPSWRPASQERHVLKQHVPAGCVPPRESHACNVGCNWQVSVKFPPNYVPTHCPITHASFEDTDWFKNISFDFTSQPSDDMKAKITILNNHSGHNPSHHFQERQFLPVCPEVKSFAHDLLSWGLSPSDVEATISHKCSVGKFKAKKNARVQPTLREIQDWSQEVKKRDWLAADSWDDMLLKVEALKQAGHVVVEKDDYDPENPHAEKRGFKLYVQHRYSLFLPTLLMHCLGNSPSHQLFLVYFTTCLLFPPS